MAVSQRSRSQRSAVADDTPKAAVTPPKKTATSAKSVPRKATRKSAANATSSSSSPKASAARPATNAAQASDRAEPQAQASAARAGATSPFEGFASMLKGAALGQAGLPQWPGLDVGAVSGWSQALAKPLAGLDPMKNAVEAMGASLGSTLSSIAGLSVPPEQLKGIQEDYVKQATELWNHSLDQGGALKANDRRFAAPEWHSNPGSAFMAAMYLLNSRTLQRMADSLQGDEKARQRVRFAVQQWADAASPSNFLAFNPEVIKKAIDTKGESLTHGMQHLMHDLRQGHMSQTDESVFEVGRNVATTAGTVVFENAYFQLIEYTPITPKVHETPFLFVPPCINKFYILDLQPDNSLVRYVLSQGHRVFMVSWVNADESLAKSTWDDYVEHGVIKAINVTRDIAKVDQINALGFCVGGTLLATALATLAAKGEKPVASLTLLTTFLDFVNTGTMDVFVDEAMVSMREMSLGPKSPQGGGLMKGGDLAATFSFLRANDLVWNYVVGNYLKGEMPPAFDLLYWNSDSTNLPGPMYTWYLRNTYLGNKLCKPGGVSVLGQPLDMRLLDMPTFVYASREDHIVPWDSAYASTQVVQGDCTFVLGASGHIAGVINPPEKKKRSHWVAPKLARGLPETAQSWFAQAQEHPGSWWPVWSQWLASHAGAMQAAPKQPGNKQYPAIEAAPGRYVLRKA